MPSSENVGIKRYRKRPIEIIAVQWTGKNLKEIVDFIGLNESVKNMLWKNYKKLVEEKGLKIFIDGYPYVLEIGDFIIKNLDGCFFPYSPGAFYMEYEEVR